MFNTWAVLITVMLFAVFSGASASAQAGDDLKNHWAEDGRIYFSYATGRVEAPWIQLRYFQANNPLYSVESIPSHPLTSGYSLLV